MPENILVVEYEPRYTDRVRQALIGQPLSPTFARDGEEALRSLDGEQPKLIVLSSVVPKISTSELIRAIRGRKLLAETPILLTVSGYNGKSPKADAQRMGASDILPKPYSETEFLGKVQQMLGLPVSAPQLDGDFTVRATPSGGLTSNEIFGELLDEDRPKKRATGTVDQMLADTLAGVMPSRRKEAPAAPAAPPQPSQPQTAPPAAPPTAPPPQAAAPAAASKPKTSSGTTGLDKMLSDTLSGLEKSARKGTSPGNVPRPATPTPAPNVVPTPTPAAAVPATQVTPQAPPRFNTEKMKAYEPDRVPVSQPVFPAAVPPPAKVDDEEPVDGVKFGQYVLVEKIATGGMAEVWKARMRGVEGFQKIVAIKKILPHLSDNQDFIEMFIDEAKLAAQLNHNNIIHIYDLGKIQSSYYIAMEYIDGYDLKTILRRGQERDQPVTVDLALFIAAKIAAALDYAHRKRDFEDREMGIVHRDVSPQNVLISQEGDIKLCDFGIAKAASKASHTQAGALKGKLQYMSPEQAWGRNIDKRSDVFALATVLFELLTGKKLFAGDNELSILEQVREARVQPPSVHNDEVTPEIDAIVLKALHKDPASRYQSAGEMARELDAILYSFRPTPTSADLAIYMHRLSTAEPVIGHAPEPEPARPEPPPPAPIAPAAVAAAAAAAPAFAGVPVAAAAAPAPHAHSVPDFGAVPEPVKRKSPVAFLAIGIVVIGLGIGGWMMMRGKGDPAAPAAQTTSASALTPPVGTQTAPIAAADTSLTSTAGTAAATSTGPAIDPSLVDQEVARRIAAERARLEAQARATQTPAATATQPAARPVTLAPAPAIVQNNPPPTATVAPPVTQPERPAPVQVTETQAPAPTPAPAAPQPQRAREGDLVPVGTEGLTPPRMLKRAAVPYPAVARMQKIQGTVITSVLVNENGTVTDVKIIRGINRPVGLNEAAESMMRRSSFAPGTKDGVRVRTWVTVPVEFKL